MKNKKCVTLGVLLTFLIVAIGYYMYLAKSQKNNHQQMTTYFEYNSAKIKALPNSSLSSNSVKELHDLDEITFDVVKAHKLGDIDVARIFSYVYTGQSDFALIAYNRFGSTKGSVTPITLKVLSLFFPTDVDEILHSGDINTYANDEFTTKLTDLVYDKLKARVLAENKQEKLYPELVGSQYWAGERPYFGQHEGSRMPWYLKKSSQFRASPPPNPDSPEWNKQLNLVETARKNITDYQRQSVIFWAGGPGTATPPGIWITLANDYMFNNNVPLIKIFKIRGILARAVDDSAIAAFDSKYTYWVMRPNMRDKSLQTVMPTPNHPSYPAGHSTISSGASTVLDYLLPEAKSKWDKAMHEASQGRVWGGIHFPADAVSGEEVGTNVGKEVIRQEQKKEKNIKNSAPDIE